MIVPFVSFRRSACKDLEEKSIVFREIRQYWVQNPYTIWDHENSRRSACGNEGKEDCRKFVYA